VEVLPCPFCGLIPVISQWHGGPITKRRIGCGNNECAVMPGVTGETLEIAVARWNQREAP